MNIANLDLIIRGRFVKMARLRDEWYDFIAEPARYVETVRDSGVKADLFTFLQKPTELETKHPFHLELQPIPVLPITTYEHWLKKQINDKTRNMIRKAPKSGVEIRAVDYTDDFIKGVVELFNESPIRQGRRFWHYGKDFDTVKRELGTFPERSHFAGAYLEGELIGFIKLTKSNDQAWACLMQVISKVAHRNKAPNNALMARAVEMCAEMKIPSLQYGTWSTGGLGEYKARHGFVRIDVPRYFVPLNLSGRLALKLRLHRDLKRLIPQKWLEKAVAWRGAWYSHKYEKNLLRAGR